MRPLNSRRLSRLLLVACLSSAASRAVAAPQASLDAQLAQALSQVSKQTSVAVCAVSVADDRVWYASNADLPLKPASVQKLFVTAAALEHFPADFALETRLLRSGEELWIIGGGDPGLGDPRLLDRSGLTLDGLLEQWAQQIAQAFDGAPVARIVLDDSVFDDQLRHPDWPDSQQLRWYQAPVCGLVLNDNCVDAALRVSGPTVEVRLTPPLPPTFVRNDLRLGSPHKPTVTRQAGSDVLVFTGKAAKSAELDPITVARPTLVLGAAIQVALERRGVRVTGPIVRRTITPEDERAATPILRQRTPLRDLVWRCNNFSQNLFAECLLKSLAAYDANGRRTSQGSWPGGVARLEEILRSLGVDPRDAVFRDGSGLSHENRATARQIAELLCIMHHHRQCAAFLESLAVPGEEGTLRSRFARSDLRGRIRAKTGSIQGVATLAGYLTRDDGRVLAFAILENGEPSYPLMTRICEILAAAPPP